MKFPICQVCDNSLKKQNGTLYTPSLKLYKLFVCINANGKFANWALRESIIMNFINGNKPSVDSTKPYHLVNLVPFYSPPLIKHGCSKDPQECYH